MSVNVYDKSSDSLNPIAGRTPDDKVSKSNVLNTLEEISASTNPLDVAGASAVRELSSELGGFKPVIDETTGQITGYKTSIGGADTVFPFSNFEIEEFYTNSNDAQNYGSSSSASSASSNTNLTVPAGKYIVFGMWYRCTTRDNDHAMQGWTGIIKPTIKTNATLLYENDNYIVVESDSEIIFNCSFSTSGFSGGTLTIGTRVNAFKIG